jgi:hypothetical protein
MFTGDVSSAVNGGPGIQAEGQVLVDTARGYQSGQTEETIGSLLSAHPELRPSERTSNRPLLVIYGS